MKVKVVGYSNVDYFSKKRDKQVRGIQFFVEFQDRNTTGYRTDNIYLNESFNVVPPLTLPAEANVSYNRFGYVEDFYFT